MDRNLLVVGATGLLGRAILKHFRTKSDWHCMGLSRRSPDLSKVLHVKSDLMDKSSLDSHYDILKNVTHVVYGALYEMDDLISGWQHKQQIEYNTIMFQNLMSCLVEFAPNLTHVSLLQGTKAYGIHVEPMKAPAKESWPRHQHENFYWYQEDILKDLQKDGGWSFNIWRPQVVFGAASGSPMNLVAAVAAYATICRELEIPCCYPGGGHPIITEATDAHLFAEALEWAFKEPKSHNQTYNITNGDVLIWPHLWPMVCDYFQVAAGEPKEDILSESMPKMEKVWLDIVEKYNLNKLTLKELVGGSWQFLDRAMRPGGRPAPPSLVSTIKIRQAGFNSCLSTDQSLRRCFDEMRTESMIP